MSPSLPAKLPQSSGALPSSNQSVPKAVPNAGEAGEPGGAPGQRESEPGAQPPSSSTAWRLWGGGRRAECHGREMGGERGRGCGRTLGEVRGEEAAGGEGEAELLRVAPLTSESLLPDIRKSSRVSSQGLCRSDRLHPLKSVQRYYRVCAWRNWGDQDCVFVS